MQSICDQLLHEKTIGEREIRNIKCIWIERDPVLVQQVDFVKSKQDVEPGSGNDTALDRPEHHSAGDIASQLLMLVPPGEHSAGNIVSQLLVLVPPGETTDEELEQQYADGGLPNVDDQPAPPPPSECDDENPACDDCPTLDTDKETSSTDALSKPVSKEDIKYKKSLTEVLDMQVYLTGNASFSGNVPFARVGRPDIKALFEEMKSNAIASGDKKVAVCVCAPQKLMSLCHRACVLYSDDKVRFDFHAEAMS